MVTTKQACDLISLVSMIATDGFNKKMIETIIEGLELSDNDVKDQVVKCLIIYEGKLVLPTDDFETINYELEQVKTLIKFFLSESIRKKYYFEFHY